MDFTTLFHSIQSQLGQYLPSILGAILILVAGWFIAMLVRAGLNQFFSMVGLNKRIADTTGSEIDFASGISFSAFALIILMTLMEVFSNLNLDSVSGPLNALFTQIFDFLPKIAGGAILAVVAWGLATFVKYFTNKAMSATSLDEKLSNEAGMSPVSNHIGNMLFWIIILMFLPLVLSTLELDGLLLPVQGMVDQMLGMVPNILGAGVIGFVGWIVAKIFSGLVSNILATTGIDKLTADMEGNIKLSSVIGTVVFVFVFVPLLIAALDALQIDVISGPATDMLSMVLSAVPNIIGAAIILTVTYYVSKFAASIIVKLLSGVGFNAVPAKLGFADTFSKESTAADLVGKIIVFFALLFASVEAANRLGFSQVSDIVGMFIQFGGDILLGSVILMIGFWLANLAYKAIDKASGKKSTGLANIARFAIIGLVIAMGLRAMGIADDIVNMAFGLTLGAIAVAVALAFGLGGREAAGKQLEYWFSKIRDGGK